MTTKRRKLKTKAKESSEKRGPNKKKGKTRLTPAVKPKRSSAPRPRKKTPKPESHAPRVKSRKRTKALVQAPTGEPPTAEQRPQTIETTPLPPPKRSRGGKIKLVYFPGGGHRWVIV